MCDQNVTTKRIKRWDGHYNININRFDRCREQSDVDLEVFLHEQTLHR